jgi:hypothetical protein
MKLTGENRSTRGKNLSQCHFIHQKPHMDLRGERPATNRLSHGKAPQFVWNEGVTKYVIILHSLSRRDTHMFKAQAYTRVYLALM